MAAKTKTTTDHDEIRRWAEERGGRPARVKGTGSDGDPGMLRIDFPGFAGEESLEEISWDRWLEWFDRNNLALIIDTEPPGGKQARFNKLVSRSRAGRARPSRARPSRARTTRAKAAKGKPARASRSKAAKKPVKSARRGQSGRGSSRSRSRKGGSSRSGR